MIEIALHEGTWQEWRQKARGLLSAGVSPLNINWRDPSELSFRFGDEADVSQLEGVMTPTMNRKFLESAPRVAAHRNTDKWNLLYNIAWKMQSQPEILENAVDIDVRLFQLYLKAVNFDSHKLKAYLRFKKIQAHGAEIYTAWHDCEHNVLPLTASFFARRFSTMNWLISTPWCSAAWNGKQVLFSAGVKQRLNFDDDLEELWLTYYKSTFNPARLKLKAMMREMPHRYWSTMPETKLIPGLVNDASSRLDEMVRKNYIDISSGVPEYSRAAADSYQSLAELQSQLSHCGICTWASTCSQVVCGSGNESAKLVIVGEQPGDEEDEAGLPFVGPAGRLLRQVLGEAGIPQKQLYFTNAVKHFKHKRVGKRRIHERPSTTDIVNCNHWLSKELELINPSIIICLGATAAQAVLGRKVRILQEKGQWIASLYASKTMMLVHPAAILRANDKNKGELYKELLTSMKEVKSAFASADVEQ